MQGDVVEDPTERFIYWVRREEMTGGCLGVPI